MKIAYFDCFSGAAGDMIVGACLDAGADWRAFQRQIDSLGLDEVSLKLEKVQRNGIAASLFTPVIQPPPDSGHHGHRHLPDILERIRSADLSDPVRERAVAIFNCLGQAEARVHGIPVEQVHFHEVGAADAIVDIVGACVALDLLGVEAVYASALAVGSGTVTCAHGVLPVPAPATADIIRGVPTTAGAVSGELLTPTGAAILKTLVTQFGPAPDMCCQVIGYGAGQRQYPAVPNVLRVRIGQAPGRPDEVLEPVVALMASIDDMSGELVGHVAERLLELGALDVYYTAIGMKKSRPGVELTVLCRPEQSAALESVLFAETTTLGVRRIPCTRSVLTREWVTVTTRFGPVRMKVGSMGPRRLNSAPEYEDCRALAERAGVSVKEVMAAALARWEMDGSGERS